MTEPFVQMSERLTCRTSVRSVVRLDSDVVITLKDNIIRAAQGGQPQDQGVVVVRGCPFPVGQVSRSAEDTLVTLKGAAHLAPMEGEEVDVAIDGFRRQAFARSHTLGHLLMAATRRLLQDFVGDCMEIDHTGTSVSILFHTTSKLDDPAVNMIDCLTRHLITCDVRIDIVNVPSLDAGARRFPRWRADSDVVPSGNLQVVDIVGIDASPCRGSHVSSTKEVGPYSLKLDWAHDLGIYRLVARRTSTWMYWFGEQALRDFDWDASTLI